MPDNSEGGTMAPGRLRLGAMRSHAQPCSPRPCVAKSRSSRRDPEQTFGHLVARWSWVYFFGIPSTFYEIDVCRQKCAEYLEAHSEIRTKLLDVSVVCVDLCKIDPMFPPLGLWVDYYGVNELSDIIEIFKPIMKKKGLFS